MDLTFNVRWINPLMQYGHVDLTAVVTNDQGVIPMQRVERSWSLSAAEATEEFLAVEARKITDQLAADYSEAANEAANAVELQPEEPS